MCQKMLEKIYVPQYQIFNQCLIIYLKINKHTYLSMQIYSSLLMIKLYTNQRTDLKINFLALRISHVKRMPCKHEDLNSDPRTHIKAVMTVHTCNYWRMETGGSWKLSRQTVQKKQLFLGSVRVSASKNKNKKGQSNRKKHVKDHCLASQCGHTDMNNLHTRVYSNTNIA